MPVFWFGLMLQILFAVKLGWLPSAGMRSATGGGTFDLIKHMILPALTLAIGSIGGWSRYLRSSTLEVLGQDYVRTARAKGLREQRRADPARAAQRDDPVPDGGRRSISRST